MSKKARSNILLLITSIIWGSAFVAQKAGTALEPFTYNGIRMMVACITLLPVIAIFSNRINSSDSGDTASNSGTENSGGTSAITGESSPSVADSYTSNSKLKERKTLLIGGLVCGLAIFCGSNLQQFGLYNDTDAGKAGFITTLYIVIVPVLGIFLKRKVSLKMWICVIIGAIGFYLLTMAGKGEGFAIKKGELFLLAGSFAFSLHIMAVDYFSPKCDGIKLSCAQFFVSGFLGMTCMLIFEHPDINAILSCTIPILYAGMLSSGIGYTFQIIAQKDADPTTASLIMSLEAVFAVLSGALIYSERLSTPELMGCIVIFAAVIISQLPSKSERENTK